MKYPERYVNAGIPKSPFAYAELLTKWEERARAKSMFFSVPDDDLFFIQFAKEISEHFGLEILRADDSELRVQAMVSFKNNGPANWSIN